ncbi:MAG: YkgJ family cysteine cluster protein [Thermoguttaceae bacterium]|nr:YkgJ family cysteine cluster protein [Thermoguttaceae bacterium]
MPKSKPKKSPCASCKSRSTRETSAARTAKAAESVKAGGLAKSTELGETGGWAKTAESGGLVKSGKPTRRPKKSEVPPERLCEFCDAKCCRYFALPIDKPSTFEEFDYVRWYLLHEGASVFVEDGDWFLLVHSPCKELGPDNRCRIYETRPQICREYSTARCEYDDLFLFEQYFETPEQVEEYAVATLGPRPETEATVKPTKPVKTAAKKETKGTKSANLAGKSAKSANPAAKKETKKKTEGTKKTKRRASTEKSTKRGA